MTLRRSEEFVTIAVRAVVCLHGSGVIDAHLGAGLQRRMQMWAAALPR